MKIIQLLNKIANGEEPKIKYNNYILKYNKNEKRFIDKDRLNSLYEIDFSELNEKVEIIEEEKKIPEKLKIEQDTPTSNYYIRNKNGTKCALTKHSKMIAETLNQVIDYLKSKGE